ncbi:MAG: beta-galactosidase [Marinilabiliaceae bacterium]|nr:beta-galactosidase [Marinilabiliaceae bacterium]
MNRIIRVIVVALILFSSFTASGQQQVNNFKVGDKAFLLNDKPFVIKAGEIHFPRIPREYWEHRVKMVKAMGMNTICIYLFWNYHEETLGKFDFTGNKDVAAFVKLIQDNGMYCIVRPGPYACAEWDMGGLPWWLLKKKDLQVRTKDDPYYMERAKLYLKEVGKQLAPLQIQNGGNILMVQVENEYAVFGKDGEYMAQIRDAVRESGFDKVDLFRCDWSSTFNKYKLDGVATTLNFGAGSNVDDQFKKFKEIYPNSPLMCSEYWTGWFDYWGRPHETRSISSFIGSLKDMLDRDISFSLYMAHGGTSFGQWGGANSPPFGCMVASYDYNAPINEAGQATDKFYAVRDLLNNYLQEGESLGEIPEPYPVIEIPEFELTQSANLFDNLPSPNKTVDIKSMEHFDQGWGRILYRTKLPASKNNSKLVITKLHDWAVVYIDGKYMGKMDRRLNENAIELPPLKKGAQLDILVEAMGRVNYGKTILDPKGITQKVELILNTDTIDLKNWLVYNFPVDDEIYKNMSYSSNTTKGPKVYKGTFSLEKTGDTWFDLSKWGKGMVWVNGYNIGRYWQIGPQQTLFMPGCWLKKGDNEIMILDLMETGTNKISGVSIPVLDVIKADASLIHRKDGEVLNLQSEKPVFKGSFVNTKGWQDVDFKTVTQGRYFCLEALNAQNEKDMYSSIAELDILDENNQPISRLDWKIVYATSEEVTAANCSANKIFDTQESTMWHTAWVSNKVSHPHHIVIDLGVSFKIKGLRYLPRTDNNNNGNVKDFNVYVKSSPFIISNF